MPSKHSIACHILAHLLCYGIIMKHSNPNSKTENSITRGDCSTSRAKTPHLPSMEVHRAICGLGRRYGQGSLGWESGYATGRIVCKGSAGREESISVGRTACRSMVYVPPAIIRWAKSSVFVAERWRYWSMAQDFQHPIMRMVQSSTLARSRAMAPPARRAHALISLQVMPSVEPIALQLV